MSVEYLVREEDGTSRYILEDGSGFLILETSDVADDTSAEQGGGPLLAPGRRRTPAVTPVQTRGYELAPAKVHVKAYAPALQVRLVPEPAVVTVRSRATVETSIELTVTTATQTLARTRTIEDDLARLLEDAVVLAEALN